jgi:hypothetical protein
MFGGQSRHGSQAFHRERIGAAHTGKIESCQRANVAGKEWISVASDEHLNIVFQEREAGGPANSILNDAEFIVGA